MFYGNRNEYTLYSRLRPDALMARLRMNTFARRVLGADGVTAMRRFYGTIGQASFEISRVVDRMNVFEPILSGAVSPFNTGSELRLRLAPQPPVHRATCLIVLFFAVGTLLCLWQMARTGFVTALLMPAVLLLLILTLPAITYHTACKQAKAALFELMELTEAEPE